MSYRPDLSGDISQKIIANWPTHEHPPECHEEGGASRTPHHVRRTWGLFLSIYSRRQLLANAAMAVSRVAA